MLEVDSVSVTLGGTDILDDVSLCAQAGEVTAIVGPNGSGKTTLLRALTGEVAFEGTVRLNGLNVATARGWELAQQRAVLPQAATLAFLFTVGEVVEIGVGAGLSAGSPGVARQALERVGLSGYADRYYQELSGGEAQRVQLARVLAQVWEPRRNDTPSWLFLDEPVSSLDIGHQLAVMEIARDFARAGGGVLTVMHDLNLTAMYADQVALLHQGQLLRAGPVPEVLTDTLLSKAYGHPLRTDALPPAGQRFLLPQAAGQVETTF